jgi:predicted phage terminase large subunit-like protein
MQRERIESAVHEGFVRKLAAKYKVRYHGVEKATYGLTLIQVMRRVGLPVLELKPDKDKVSRAWPAVGFIENGAIYFPPVAAWLADYELELEQFPYGANDDMVDVTAYAARHLADRVRPAQKEKPPPGARDRLHGRHRQDATGEAEAPERQRTRPGKIERPSS